MLCYDFHTSETVWDTDVRVFPQEHVEQFAILVEEIRGQCTDCPSSVIATSLSRAKHTLDKLDHLIQVNLAKNVHGTSRARRRVWARNKSKIYEIENELKEHRANLTAALSANSM